MCRTGAVRSISGSLNITVAYSDMRLTWEVFITFT